MKKKKRGLTSKMALFHIAKPKPDVGLETAMVALAIRTLAVGPTPGVPKFHHQVVEELLRAQLPGTPVVNDAGRDSRPEIKYPIPLAPVYPPPTAQI